MAVLTLFVCSAQSDDIFEFWLRQLFEVFEVAQSLQ